MTLFLLRLNIILLLLTLFIPEAVSQNGFRVMFYNVENLFDTHDEPLKNDNDFLPDGFMRWTNWKYKKKQSDITKVITAVGGMQSPALVGLCEVENDSVLIDLTKRSPLRAQEYEFIISNSPDERGIEVALLYQRHQFKLLEDTEYEIIFSDKNRRPTRNILHAVGTIVNGDTLDVFVCHFPSRVSGRIETEQARIESARVLRTKVDSLLSARTNLNLIIMGDFNDSPNDKSLRDILKANEMKSKYIKEGSESRKQLYNLLYRKNKATDYGTYKYKGVWTINDHLIVNGNLLNEESNIKVKLNKSYIYKKDFLLEVDEKYYGKKPYRTYVGPRYIGGFSDHLPIFMDLIINNAE